MATQWYYLDGFTENGPFDGKQMKRLADAGAVIPSTPVKRASGTEVSPWTRAGAIQGMFTGDVRDKLGDPICDDCGQVLKNGICQICSIGTSTPPPRDDYPPIDDLATSRSTYIPSVYRVERKYPNLRIYVDAIRFWAKILFFLSVVGAGLFFAAGMIAFVRDRDLFTLIVAVISGIAGFMVGWMFYVLTMALAELFMVVVDTEENTRRMALMLEGQKT
jgi:hypothetical protein